MSERDAVCTSEESNEAVSTPDVKYDFGASSEERESDTVVERHALARRSCLARRNAELLETAETSVEVRVQSLCEGRSQKIYLF